MFLWIETLFKDCVYNSLQSKMAPQISMTGCDEAKIKLTNAILMMKVFLTSCLAEDSFLDAKLDQRISFMRSCLNCAVLSNLERRCLGN